MREHEHARPQSAATTDAFAVLALLLLAVVPYLNSLAGSFVYDDRLQIVGNPYVHSFRYLGKIFGSTVWTFEGAQGVTNYYRPLMTFAYLICFKLFGPIPFGFHLLNIVLHAAVVILVFAVTERLFGNRLMSLVAAGLFALHPVHTESVAWIAALPDLELGVFFLLAFLLYLRLAPSGPNLRDPQNSLSHAAQVQLPHAAPQQELQAQPRAAPHAEPHAEIRLEPHRAWGAQAAMLAAYILALLSKEQALVLPAIVVIYEHLYRADRAVTSLRTKLARYAGLWMIAAAYVAFRVFVLGGFAPSVARPTLSWSRVLLTAISLIGSYLWKLIWPVHLSAFYVFHESTRISDTGVLLGLLALLACLNVFVWLWSRAHPTSFAFLWMGVTLGPVLNARWMPAGVFAERYLYLPSVGFCWLLGWAAVAAWRASPTEFPSPPISNSASRVPGSRVPASTDRVHPDAASPVAAPPVAEPPVAAPGAAGSRAAGSHAAGSRAAQSLSRSPGPAGTPSSAPGMKIPPPSRTRPRIPFLRRAVPAVIALIALLYGVRTIRRNRDWRTEEVLFRKTLDEQPDAQLIRTNLGVIYWERHDEAGAEREWLAALGPGHAYASTLNNLGLLRSHQKRYPEAISFFQQAIALRPNFMDPHKNLALAYAEMQRSADADREFRKAVMLAPLSSDARNAYGHFLLDQKRTDEAQEQFRLSAAADPNADADENLGDIFAAKGDSSHARAAFSAALALDPYDNHARFALAALDEQEKRYAEAIREYRAGLQTDPANRMALAAIQRLAAKAAR